MTLSVLLDIILGDHLAVWYQLLCCLPLLLLLFCPSCTAAALLMIGLGCAGDVGTHFSQGLSGTCS